MAATVTRRVLRRFRLGGRHTYRAAARQRVALAIAAAVAVITVGAAAGAGHEAPPAFSGPGWSHSQPHGPMAGGLPDRPGRPGGG